MSGRHTLDEILREHHPALLKIAYRLCGNADDAQDLVQVVNLWAVRHAFVVIAHENPEGLLTLVMNHRFIDWLRRKKNRGVEDGDPDEEIEKDQPLARWMDREHLEKAVRQLPPEMERVVRLRLKDLTFREIAERLGCTLNQAFKLYQDALVLLEKYLEKLHKDS
ncbi:MAG TPA: RNA polymerase sigma factor [Myxococcaceae bacterium]|nr:RNA polymerase sigma factor [Myxococcaceae bacterium]